MVTFMRMPDRCGEPACRRSRRCVGPTMRCNRDFPQQPLTEAESAEAIADLREAVTERMRQLGKP
jgi:hypothetical protein